MPRAASLIAPTGSHMVPMKRVGTAEEIANAIVWLMSDDASYVTSAILDVSGGRYRPYLLVTSFSYRTSIMASFFFDPATGPR